MEFSSLTLELPQSKATDKKVARFIIASFFLHISVIAFLNSPLRDLLLTQEKHADASRPVEVEILPLPNTKMNKQVVESAKIKKSETVADDAFLSEQNQIVDRQTKAAQVAAFRNGHIGDNAKTESKKDQTKPSEKFKDVSLGTLGLAKNLKPMGHIGPGETAATSDHLDVKEGSQTLLNTREFAYYSFYQRVRQQLEQFWEPGLRTRLEKMLDRGRTIASDKEHATRLLVVMDKGGMIKKIQVENTSGYTDLDQAAVDAFNKAGPFPNPPTGLVEYDGTVKVEWEFVLRT